MVSSNLMLTQSREHGTRRSIAAGELWRSADDTIPFLLQGLSMRRPFFTVSVLLGSVVPLAAAPQSGELREFEIADGVKMGFVWIPASQGNVNLGSPKEEQDEVKKLLGSSLPARVLQLIDAEKEHEYEQQKGFWMAKHETTQAEWEAVLKKTPFSFHRNGGGVGANKVQGINTSRFPAENVSFDDIYGRGWNDGDAPKDGSFLQKVNARPHAAKVFGAPGKFRLPTLDEWEYAYRGGKGNKQAFYWGDALNGDKANCDGGYPYGTETKGNSLGRPAMVGSYEKAAPHAWGLCDMSGNVFELCENWHDGEHKYVWLRGGAWSHRPISCRAASRFRLEPNVRVGDVGFRLVFRLD